MNYEGSEEVKKDFSLIYHKAIKPIYDRRYKKYIDIVIKYCYTNKLDIINFYILNKMFDSYDKYGPDYIIYIAAANPYYVANDLSNILAENELDISLFTNELHKNFTIKTRYHNAPFFAVCKKIYLHGTIEVKPLVDSDVKYFTYPYVTHIMYMYYIMSNLSMRGVYDIAMDYKNKLLERVDLKFTDRPTSYKVFLNDKILSYIQKNNRSFMAIGSFACNLLDKTTTYLGTIQFLTGKDLEELIGELKTLNKKMEYKLTPFTLYNSFHFHVLTVTYDNFRIMFYNILKFLPIKIYDKINNIYIGDVNIILCILFNDLIYTPDTVHDRIKKSIKFIMDLPKSKYNDFDVSSYLGQYINPANYLKEYYYKNAMFFSIYNPIDWKKKNGSYREIIIKT